MSDPTPSRPNADRNLLLGILALQMDFISRDALVAAMNAWVLDKAKSLGHILVEQKALKPDQCDAMNALVDMHLGSHGGEPEKSLAALAVPPPLHDELRGLDDDDVQASLAHVPTPSRDGSTLPVTMPDRPGASGLRYQVLRPHRKGGIGEVFVALDQELNREIALKEIRQERADDPHSRGRFVREAEITGGLEHPGIVPVYGLGQYGDGRPFYAMRFIQGQTLKDAIARYHRSSPVASAPRNGITGDPEAQIPARSPEFELRALLTRFVAVCNTIAYAHNRGVLHRDIKPANVMLGKYGETLIVDWGLAKALSDSPVQTAKGGLSEPALVPHLVELGETLAGVALGTPAYMSPEQAAGRVDLLGPASDIYSLGATLYTLLTGRPPIEGKATGEALDKARRGEWLPARQISSDVPAALDAICQKAMALKPEQRYGTALELAADVEHWLADEPVSAWQEPWTMRTRRWIGRHRTWVSTVAAAVLVAFLASLGGLFLLAAAEERERRANRDQAEARRIAEDKEKEVRQNLYVAEMNLVQKEYDANNIEHARELLANWMPTESNPVDRRGLEWHYWQLRAHRELLTLKGHTSWIPAVCFSPDGTRLASASNDQTIKVWDSKSGQELLTLKEHAMGVLGVCFSPDGTRLASASWDQTVKVWDSRSGQRILTLNGHTNGVLGVCFNHDGTRLASASEDKTVKVWDLKGCREGDVCPPVLTLEGHTNRVQGVCFSPDGMRLASASWDHTVKVWDSSSGQALLTLEGHTSSVQSVSFSPDGTRLASASDDLTVRVWDSSSGKELVTLRGHTPKGHSRGVLSVCFSPDGTQLASASWDQTVKVWDSRSGEELLTLKGHTNCVMGVCFNPDGTRLASSSWDQTVKVWDSRSGQELLTLKGHTNGVPAVRFSPDGTRLASASDDQMVKVWEGMSGQELLTLKGHTKGVLGVCFSPDGARLASASWDQTVKVWDSRSGRELLTFKGHTKGVLGICFSPDGARLASASDDKTVKVWDSMSGEELLTLEGHTNRVQGVCFSPDGARLASASWDQTVKVWDSTSGKELLTLKGHTNAVQGVCFDPDGSRLASASHDETVKLWDSTSGRELLTLRGHTSWVLGVCFSPDGTRLASAGHDETVKVWNSTSGQELLTLKGQAGGVPAVCYDPDGTRLASASDDQTVKVWEWRSVSPDTLLKRAIVEKVHGLFSRLLLKELVLRDIRMDPWFDTTDRRFALEVARTHSENPIQLNRAAWQVVRASGGKREAYARALPLAEAAVQAAPSTGRYLTTLGIVHYRLGNYAKALEILTQSEKLNATKEGAPPADLGFLAMAQHQHGNKEIAKATLARLREVTNQERWAKDAEAQSFLREAEELILGQPATKQK
jgi:WD40 repeat protein/serine/threonine protein kinase